MTVSSLEIADLCCSDISHEEILADLQVAMKEAGIGILKFEGTYRDAEGHVQPCYRFPKDACEELSICFPDDLRAAVDQLWAEKLGEAPFSMGFNVQAECIICGKLGCNHLHPESQTQSEPEPEHMGGYDDEEREAWAYAAKKKRGGWTCGSCTGS